MEWSFIFYQRCWNVLHCIFHYYCPILIFVMPRGFLFLREQGFYLRRNVKLAQSFLWIVLPCLQSVHPVLASFPPFARASSVRAVAELHPEWPDQAKQPFHTANNRIEAQYFFWAHPLQHKAHKGHWEAQTDKISDCKAFQTLWSQLSAWYLFCKICACNDPPPKKKKKYWIILVWALRCFSASLIL